MSKAELVQAVVKRTGLGHSAAQAAVDATLGAIADALQKGEEVRLTGFGTFLVRRRAARKGMDIRTRAPIDIPERNAVVFRASKSLAV